MNGMNRIRFSGSAVTDSDILQGLWCRCVDIYLHPWGLYVPLTLSGSSYKQFWYERNMWITTTTWILAEVVSVPGKAESHDVTTTGLLL